MSVQTGTISDFIEAHIAEIEPLYKNTALAAWEFEMNGTPEAEEKLTKYESELSKIYTRKNEYKYLTEVNGQNISDPLTARMHTQLINSYRGAQMDPLVMEDIIKKGTALASKFNNYRAELRGEKISDNELDNILRSSDDSQLRKEAWAASKQIGAQVAESVKELVSIKNREAKKLGFDNYYKMALELQEVPQDWLFNQLDELKEKSDPIYKEFKRKLDEGLAKKFNISVDELEAWHYGDKFFQAAPKGRLDLDPLFENQDIEGITKHFFETIGLPLDKLVENSDLYEREGKCQHAFCTHIDQKGDVRVLCNITPTERWMGTMLHEYGHAVYEYYTDFNLPYLLRGAAHTLTTEAIAILMGGLVHNAEWLKTYVNVPPAEAEQVAQAAREQDRAQKIVFMRWVFVVSHFERAMHEHPEADLNSLWWDLVEKFQFIKRPKGRNQPDWAAKIHIALHPAYYHNYLLGELMAAQLRHVFKTKVVPGPTDAGLVTSPKVGEYLKEKLFKLGSQYDWRETVVKSTGEALNPEYFIKELE